MVMEYRTRDQPPSSVCYLVSELTLHSTALVIIPNHSHCYCPKAENNSLSFFLPVQFALDLTHGLGYWGCC